MKQQNRRSTVSEEPEQSLQILFVSGMNGDERAYRLFLENVAGILRSFFMGIMSTQQRSQFDVEDLIQDVLIAIHRKRDFYRSDLPLIPWLHAIARYKFFDHIRARSRRVVTVAWEKEFDELFKSELPQQDPLEALPKLESLGEREKALLILAKVDELPYTKIAAQFGMTVAAVKVSIHRSLKKLRQS
jgi:RNA polymerase sigma-70 factor, ECF subfamily